MWCSPACSCDCDLRFEADFRTCCVCARLYVLYDLGQTGNFGTLPSPDMPNSFLAHAYDLGHSLGHRATLERNTAPPPPQPAAGQNTEHHTSQ